MAIRSVNYNISTSYGAYVQRLTEATKQKLIALNIPFDEKTTEAQAQAMIRAVLSKKTAESQNNKKNDSSLSNSTAQNKNNLFEKAKELAEKLGIKVDKKADIKTLLVEIEAVLSEKIVSNKDNITVLNQLKEYSSELSLIQAQAGGYSGMNNSNQALMQSLEMLSEYNKNFLKR